MPRRNRVDPWGDAQVAAERGLFTGNRGCLVDDLREIVRHHNGNLWIICVTSFRDRRHPLDRPGIWTPLFFLDDAVGLAAGHRPCAFCRPDAYRLYRDAVTCALGRPAPVKADELNRLLAAERLRRGRGMTRAADRRLWEASIDDLPDGTVIVSDGEARLVAGERTLAFDFAGWTVPRPRQGGATVQVITPPTSVGALRAGFTPVLHPSAHAGHGSETRIEAGSRSEAEHKSSW